MKKIVLIVLAVAMIASIALTSCNKISEETTERNSTTATTETVETETTTATETETDEPIETITADTKEECFSILDSFFNKTNMSNNLVVTANEGMATAFIQKKEGNKTSIEFPSNNRVIYAFRDGIKYACVLVLDGEVAEQINNLDYYELYMNYYFKDFDLMREAYGVDDSVVCSCVQSFNGNTSKLEMDYSSNGETIKFVINATDGLVTDLLVQFTAKNSLEVEETTMTFEYGNASVTLPEVDWGEETTEEIEEAVYTFEEAYNLYSEYVMSCILYSLDEDIVSASVTVNNEAVLNEVIIGEKSHAVYSPDQEVYTFIKDNQRYYASRDGEIKYYLIDDGEYNFNHSLFMFYVNLLVDNEGIVSIALSVSGTKTTTEFSTVFDGTVTVLIAYEGESGMIATVSIVNGKVVSVNTVYSDTYEQYPTSVSIGYGNSIIVLPDLTDWYNASGPAVESEWYVTGVVSGAEVEDMPMYFDYITGCYKTENVDIVMGDKIIVKNKNDDSIKYEQIVDEDYLVGNASIVFDTRYETISFESDAFED